MIICSNCGAKFKDNLPECPYCGQIYVPGAEKKYMDSLHEIKEDMSRVTDLSEGIYHKEMKKTIKNAGTVFAVFAVVFLLGAGILFGLNQMFGYSESEEEIKARILWERENFPILDQWYEEGNYQAILDFSEDAYDEKGYYLFEWEHYDFIKHFEGYQICTDIREKIRNKEALSEFEAGEVLYWGMSLLDIGEENSTYIGNQYTKEEQEQLQVWKQEIEALFYEELQYTNEELKQISKKVHEEGYLSYEACCDYGESVLERITTNMK